MEREIQIIHQPAKDDGAFHALRNGEKKGILQYRLFGRGSMIIQHTEVDPDLQGTGTARRLVLAAVDYARQESMKIVPVCPYAKAYLLKHRERFRDVLRD